MVDYGRIGVSDLRSESSVLNKPYHVKALPWRFHLMIGRAHKTSLIHRQKLVNRNITTRRPLKRNLGVDGFNFMKRQTCVTLRKTPSTAKPSE